MKHLKIHPVRRILVPTDFSEGARNALDYAVQLASKIEAKILLYHATHLPILSANELVAISSNEELERESMMKLENIRREVIDHYNFNDIETVTSSGFAVEEITELARAENLDLVVMGTKGASGISEVLMGSNSADVIEKCSCPVLTIPTDSTFKEPARIIFATNYADNDFQTLYLLSELFKPFSPEIVVLHIEDRSNHRLEDSMLEWYKGQVKLNIPYDKFSFQLIKGHPVEDALHDYVTSNNTDLLAVSTRKRSFFDRLTSKSLSRKLAYHTDLPLLVFHAQNVSGTPLF